jgi:tetratricopeptide (TPR) repeat protein
MVIRAFLFLSFVAFGQPAPVQPNVRQKAIARAQEGLRLAHEGKYPEAIKAYSDAAATDPKLPGIHLNIGLAWFKMGDFKRAIPEFEKHLTLEGANPQASTLLAISFFGVGNWPEAAKRLKSVSEAYPDNKELPYMLAQAYLNSGQYDEAAASFKHLLELDPDSVQVHMLLGQALDGVYRTSDAIAEFEAAAKAGPTEPNVHFGLGFLYWKDKRDDDAAREFREELKNDSGNAPAMAYLGDILMRAGHRDEALIQLSSAARSRPDLRVARFNLGVLYSEDQSKSAAAIEEFRAAIRLDPDRPDAHYRLARVLRAAGKTAESEQELAIVRKLQTRKHEDTLQRVTGPSTSPAPAKP